MSLVLRRSAGKEGVSIDGGRIIVRVAKVDPDGTVHLAFQAGSDVTILREELINRRPLPDWSPECPSCNDGYILQQGTACLACGRKGK